MVFLFDRQASTVLHCAHMGFIGRFIIMLLGSGIGFLLVWKANWLVDNFGYSASIEKYFRMVGGTRGFYKVLGILVICGSVLYLTGGLQKLVGGIFGPLFGSLAL